MQRYWKQQGRQEDGAQNGREQAGEPSFLLVLEHRRGDEMKDALRG